MAKEEQTTVPVSSGFPLEAIWTTDSRNCSSLSELQSRRAKMSKNENTFLTAKTQKEER